MFVFWTHHKAGTLMRRVPILLLGVVVGATLWGGCSADLPMSETKRWTVLQTREEIAFTKAWSVVRNTLIEAGYQFEVVDQKNGFMRTEWRYPRDLDLDFPYRVLVKFTSDGNCTVRVLAECDNCETPYQDIPRLRELMDELRDKLI